MSNLEPCAKTTLIRATSRASVKIRDNFYTVEYCEERMIPQDMTDEACIQIERDILWDKVNSECDSQIEDIVKTFK